MSDCDGYTSSAILINYLNCLFPHFAQTNITYRVHEGKQHGLLANTIPNDVKLVIAPDAASNDFEQHKELYDRGIDVLVLDHHQCSKYSEYACVINNQMCDYPTKALSGAGIVYKFCCYLDSLLGCNYSDNFVDLAALGIMADVMSLKELEVRAIISRGMEEFKNPLLRAIVEKDKFHFEGTRLTPYNITWYVSPLLNAISRSGTILEKQVVFESMIDFLAYELIPSTKRGCTGQKETRVEQAVRTCTNVKNRQGRSTDAALEVITNLIEKQNLLADKILVIKLDKKYAVDKNLLGLIANGFQDTYHRPCLLLNEVEEDGILKWQGSGRGYDKANLGGFREFLEDSELVEYAQGHSNAFGCSIVDENVEPLIQYANETYKDFDFSPTYKVDFILHNVEPQLINNIVDENYLWGTGVDEPLIALEGLRLYGPKLNLYGVAKGNPTLVYNLDDGVGVIKFKSSEQEYENLYSELGYVIINAVGNCMRNNRGFPQIKIVDYEIIGRKDYYF